MPTVHNLKNPDVPTLANPVDLDLAIQTLQIDLASKVSWLEKSFGRARAHSSTLIESRIEPKIYQSNGEYYPVLPNDALRSYCFFRVPSDRRPEDYNANAYTLYEITRVDNIFWGNLQAIDHNRDEIFTDELINDVRSVLNFSPNVTILRIWDEKPEDIFRGYSLEPTHRDLLLYPYFAFRVEFDLSYTINCS